MKRCRGCDVVLSIDLFRKIQVLGNSFAFIYNRICIECEGEVKKETGNGISKEELVDRLYIMYGLRLIKKIKHQLNK